MDGSVLGGRALESGADETAPGAVASVSPERGLEGVCIDPRCPSRPARVDVLAGAAAEPTVLATVFALRPWPEVGDHGFRVRWADFDPARVRHMAARDPQGRISVESGGRGLPSQADLPTLAELVSLVALAAELADPLQGPDLAAEYGVVRLSGLFDDAWYLERHPDVAAAGMDPLLHYLVAGEAEGRAASFYFDAAHYRATAGVSAAGSVLAHYVQGGFRERPATSIHFDGACYAEHYRLAPEQDALADFLAQRRLPNPNRLFDVVRYL
ncbi:MAG: hypothetical protein JO048_16405, partial [Methylobacteriaceae bacterium]|nr:hypothetical protein [Methylobacteriaceae bacterium]